MLSIVIALDPIVDIHTGVGTRFVVSLVDSFGLQRLEETLHPARDWRIGWIQPVVATP